jgi:transposase InsO family protein
MPWKESSVMDERIRFVIRLKDGESMAALCREFQISRKTGYKIFERYEECGLEGLTDRARRPHRYANQLPEQIEAAIVAARREKPNWGARKIRERLLRRLPSEVKVPARSTIHAILDRHGLVTRAKRSRTRTEGTALSAGASPNSLWCADYKGEFRLGNQRYCYPLTVTDHASRYLLLCEAMESNAEKTAFTAFERLFQERGLPQAMRSDNGVPFASPNGLFNLSRLSVWWLRLGISIERIRPGHPQQNGRHERMHLTLKKEATRPAGANLLQQQAKFDAFLEEFNNERPHEALNMQCPAEVYASSCRPYQGIGELHYPFHDKTVVVTNCGRLCLYRKKINLSTCLAGQAVGVKEVDEGIWLVSFMDYDLGYIDLEEKTLQPLENPFGPKVLPMS